jgi:hypothetical protein
MISKVPVGTRSQKIPTPNVGLDSVDGITDEPVTQYGIDQHVLPLEGAQRIVFHLITLT